LRRRRFGVLRRICEGVERIRRGVWYMRSGWIGAS
jgi:hypothetical protein